MRVDLRARDFDRVLTATALDTAYTDGQLSFEEHRTRAARAQGAVTVGQLRALVADLQLDIALPEPAVPTRPAKPRVLLILGAVVAVAAGVVGYFVLQGSSEPALAPEPALTSEPAGAAPLFDEISPIVSRPFVYDTAEGIDDFRARYLERFGSAEVLEVGLQPGDDRADVYRLDEAGRTQRIMVSGGFDPQTDTELPDEGESLFDWNALDSAVVAGVVARAPEAVGAAGGVATFVTIDSDDGEPRISVSITDAEGGSGRLETDFFGNQTYLSPAS